MERHFVIAVTLAAAVHGGLVLAIPRGRVPDVPVKTLAASASDERPTIPVVPADAPVPEIVGNASGGSSEEPPRLPDRLDFNSKSPFSVAVEKDWPTRPSLGDIATIPSDAWRVGTGDGPEAGPAVLGVRLLDRVPHARVRMAPDYPAGARHEGRSGTVTVEFVVDESGAVLAPRVVDSTDSVFNDAAVRAVSRWRFEPGTVKGRAVRFRMAVPIVFRLSDE